MLFFLRSLGHAGVLLRRFLCPSGSISLRSALLLPILLTMTGGLGGAIYLSWRPRQAMTLQLTEQLKQEVANHAASLLRLRLRAPAQVNALNSLALRRGLLPAGAELDPDELESLAAYFAQQLQQFPDLNYLGFVSAPGGFVVARRHPEDGSIWTYHTPRLLPGPVQGQQRDPKTGDPTGLTRQLGSVDLRRLVWFPQLLQPAGLRRTWVVTDFFARPSGQAPERLLVTGLPLTDAEGQVYGSLVASVSSSLLALAWAELNQDLSDLAVSFLLDDQGQLVAGQGEAVPHPLLLAVQKELGSWETASLQEQLRVVVDGIPYWVWVQPVADNGGVSFYFVLGIPEREILADVRRSTQQAALVGIGLLLGCVGVGILLSESLSRPLRRLTQLAEEFTRSGFQSWPAWDPGPIREVQTMVAAWQQAAAALRALLERLWQQQQEYRALLEQQTDLVCRYLPDTRITYANPAYIRFFADQPQELVGSRWVDSIPPEQQAEMLAILAALTPERPSYSCEREYPQADGPSRWIHWVDKGIFDTQGRLVEILSVGRDITSQKQAEQQLQALNQELEAQVAARTAKLEQALRFEGLLRCLSSRMVASLDEAEILEEVVRSLVETLGLACCQIFLLAKDSSELIPGYSYYSSDFGKDNLECFQLPNCAAEHLILQKSLALVSGVSQEWLHFCYRSNDSQLLRLLAFALWDKQEQLGMLLLGRPAEQGFSEAEVQLAYQVANLCALAMRQARLYQAAQAQVKELERLNLLKDDFLSTVSHELRTPMTNVRMALRMLQMTPEGSEKRSQYFAIALRGCDRQIELINDLLDMQRLQAQRYVLQPEDVSLPEYLADLVAEIQPRAQAKGQHLDLCIAEGLPILRTDPKCLGRILRELLNNAVKYTPQAGCIRLEVDPEGEGIRFCCSNSTEIPAAELPRIFDKFYRIPQVDRWKEGGTGLGLALVKELVKHMGGHISVSSRWGWTRFRVWLPANGCP